MSRFHLAQVNVAYARGDQEADVMRSFNAQLDAINGLAERSPGFVWRYVTDSRDPAQREFADPLVLFNMSVWEDLASLHAFTYRTAHGKVFADRKLWFREWREHVPQVRELGTGMPFLALWWIAAGHIPTAQEGIARLRLLGEQGPHAQAFTLKQAFTPEGLPVER